MSATKIQVLSCRCIVRAYDGKVVIVNADCKRHRLWHADGAPILAEEKQTGLPGSGEE